MLLTIALLRIVHIMSGVILVGDAVFLAFVFEPKLRMLAPQVRGQVMKALGPVVAPVQMISSTTVMVSGLLLVLALRHSSLSQLWATRWGWAITVGFVVTAVGIGAAAGILVKAEKQLAQAGGAVEGRMPSQEELQRIHALEAKATRWSRNVAVFGVVAVLSMAVAGSVG